MREARSNFEMCEFLKKFTIFYSIKNKSKNCDYENLGEPRLDFDSRNNWAQLRHEYYLGGRSQFCLGNLQSGAMLLGYAIECTLKQILLEVGCKSNFILHRHDFKRMFKEVKKHKAIDGVQISSDFLQYVDDYFNARYPKTKKKISEQAEKRGHFMSITSDSLSYYDDVLFHLDKWLYEYTGQTGSSIFMRGACGILSIKGGYFFHANFWAQNQFDWIVGLVEKHGGNDDALKLLKSINRELLWNIDGMPIPAGKYDPELSKFKFSEHFEYSKWQKNDQGQPTISFNSPHQFGVFKALSDDPNRFITKLKN